MSCELYEDCRWVCMLTIDAAIHGAAIHVTVMALPPDEWRHRAKVNEAVRDGLRLGPLRPAGSEGLYGVR
jgi:hypothetical protein